MFYGWLYNRVKSCKYSQVKEKKIRFFIKKKKTLKNSIETYKMTIAHVC